MSRSHPFDERQRLVRTQALSHGFFVLVGLLVVLSCLPTSVRSVMSFPGWTLTLVTAATVVIWIEMVLRDAFFDRSKTGAMFATAIVWTVLGLAWTLNAHNAWVQAHAPTHWTTIGDAVSDGMLAVMWLIVGLVTLVKAVDNLVAAHRDHLR